MGSSGGGAKAGLVAGIPYGIIEAIIVYLTLVSMKASITSTIAQNLPATSGVTASQVYSITLLIAPVVVVIFGGLMAFFAQQIRDLYQDFDDDNAQGWKASVLGALLLLVNSVNVYLLVVTFLGRVPGEALDECDQDERRRRW